MKFLFVATVLVFSIGSETAARFLVDETRDTPLELMLNLHFFYDRDFASNAGANDVKAKKKIQDITYHTKNFFKLPSFPSKIMIKVVGTTRLGDKNVGHRNLSQKFQDFKNVLRNGNYLQTTHLFLLLTSNSTGSDKSTRMEVSEGSRVCSQLNEEKALIFEYWDGETVHDTAMAITQSIGHALYVQYDDNDRRDDQSQVCERSLMARNDQGVDWSTCSSEDFTKKFTSHAGLPCLKAPEFTLKIHKLYDHMFVNQYSPQKIDFFFEKAKIAFKLNTMTPKINLQFVGNTYLSRSYDINPERELQESTHGNIRDFRDFINRNVKFSDSADLFLLISAYPTAADPVVGYKESWGSVCSLSKGFRAAVIKHNGEDEFTVVYLTRVIAHALKIPYDTSAPNQPTRKDSKGQLCDKGYMALHPPVHQVDVGWWSQCSVEFFSKYIRKVKSTCGFCLQKSFDWSADDY